MSVYGLFVLFVLTVVAVGFVELAVQGLRRVAREVSSR